MKSALSTAAAIAVVSALLAGAGGGCSYKPRFPVVSSLSDPAAAQMMTAPETGDYFLYKDNKDEPFARCYLHAGDPIGFKTGAMDMDNRPAGPAGTVSAVGGAFVVPLAAGATYEWRRVPDSSNYRKAYKEAPWYYQP